jgi:hypothetical protein
MPVIDSPRPANDNAGKPDPSTPEPVKAVNQQVEIVPAANQNIQVEDVTLAGTGTDGGAVMSSGGSSGKGGGSLPPKPPPSLVSVPETPKGSSGGYSTDRPATPDTTTNTVPDQGKTTPPASDEPGGKVIQFPVNETQTGPGAATTEGATDTGSPSPTTADPHEGPVTSPDTVTEQDQTTSEKPAPSSQTPTSPDQQATADPTQPTQPSSPPKAVDTLKFSDLGKKLGEGGNKDVYAYGDNEAVGVLKEGKSPELLTKELELLKRLDDLGLPTVNARGPIMVEGRPAVIFDQFAQGSKDVVRLKDGRIRTVGDSPYLNEQSVADLQKIRQTLVDKNIKIDDLQFLIGKDGHVVVSDPLEVYEGTKPSQNNLKMIDLLIQKAKE